MKVIATMLVLASGGALAPCEYQGRMEEAGFRVQGSGFSVQGSGVGVQDTACDSCPGGVCQRPNAAPTPAPEIATTQPQTTAPTAPQRSIMRRVTREREVTRSGVAFRRRHPIARLLTAPFRQLRRGVIRRRTRRACRRAMRRSRF